MAFKSLAEMRKGRTSIADLQKEVEKLNQTSYEKDERYWQPTVDKAGTGSAVIRFLPAPPGEDLPWVRYWNHAFEGPTGKWYIENSLTTLGQSDPVSELNTELWNSGEAGKEIARKQKRKLHYVSNIMVVTDQKAPENEGQVFLYKYGVKIFDKIKDAMNPPEGFDDAPINPFDLWEGANFKLKIQNVKGYRNYDKSEFASTSPIADDDADIEEVWKKGHSLSEVIAADKFKAYDELKKKLDFVLKGGPVGTVARKEADEEKGDDNPGTFDEMTKQLASSNTSSKLAKAAAESSEDEDDPKPAKTKASKATKPKAEEPEPKKSAKAKPEPKKVEAEEDGDDTLSYFAGLAADD